MRGFKGDTSFKGKKRVIATLKHFAAHGQPESGQNCAPVNVSMRAARNFSATVQGMSAKAKAISIMASYNEIDGVPSHASQWLLRDVLRKESGVSKIRRLRLLRDLGTWLSPGYVWPFRRER